VIFEPGKNVYFSTYPPPTLLHLSHLFTSAWKPVAWKSFDCCPAAELLLSHSPQGDLVGYHLRLSNVFDRISRPSCELLYATDTSHRNQENFFMNIICTEYFCPQKRTTEFISSVVYSSSTVDILTTETS
jgi:hypothetical protein